MSKRKSTEQFIEEAKLIHENKYDYSLVCYINNKTKIKIICNKCKNIFEQRPGDHLKGQGCPCMVKEKQKKVRKTLSDYLSKELLKKYDFNNSIFTGSTKYINVVCKNPNHFGYVFKIKPNDLKNGHGCPKCKSEKLSKTTEQFIEEAKAIHENNYDYSLVEYKGTDVKVKIKCNNCGKIFLQTPHIHLQGSGCSHCSCSNGEKTISKFLVKNKIFFKPQKTFEDLKDIKKLRYDFYIPSKNLLIEYNGMQHYKSIKKWGGVKRFHLQKHHDWLKRKYAQKNNIKFLTISYKEDLLEKLNQLFK